jgi:hypothetical protein
VIDSIGGAAAIAAAATCAIHLPAIRYGLDIGDEGYLWHGTLQALDGKIPIRDFRAYDPARYYWCALWCVLFGRRNLSIRAAMMAVQFGGLWLASMLVHEATASWGAAALWAIPMVACMRPWYRQFEFASAVATIFAVVLVIMHPAPMHYFWAGVWVGSTVVVGLNLAVYNVTGAFLAILATRAVTAQPGLPVSCGSYLLGVVAAATLWLLVCAAIPRFVTIYWREKIEPLMTRGATNLPLPIPWLWRKREAAWTPGDFPLRCFFTGVPLFYAVAFGWLLLSDHQSSLRMALFAVSICVGAAYAHHAFSRADSLHAFNAMPPMLLAVSAVLFSTTPGLGVAIAIVAATVWAALSIDQHPIARLRNPDRFSRFTTGRDSFWLRAPAATGLDAMCAAVDAHSDRGEAVFFAPCLVALYPLCEREAAVYDVYCVYPAAETRQREMIAAIVGAPVRLALVWNLDLDGRDDLRFSNTHPLVWRHLEENFEVRSVTGLPADIRCFAR